LSTRRRTASGASKEVEESLRLLRIGTRVEALICNVATEKILQVLTDVFSVFKAKIAWVSSDYKLAWLLFVRVSPAAESASI